MSLYWVGPFDYMDDVLCAWPLCSGYTRCIPSLLQDFGGVSLICSGFGRFAPFVGDTSHVIAHVSTPQPLFDAAAFALHALQTAVWRALKPKIHS